MTLGIRHFLTLIICVITGILISSPETHGGWKLESEKNGIKLYTRPVIGSKLKQVRAITSVAAPKEAVMHVLTDFNNYKNWVYNVTESYVVEQPIDSVHYVYLYEDAPWPVQNRYNVSKMTIAENQKKSKVTFQSMPHYMDNSRDAIEIERYEGSWEVSTLPGGGCRIEYMLDHNPGGYVPTWLVNYMAIDAPLKTIQNLKAIIENLHKS